MTQPPGNNTNDIPHQQQARGRTMVTPRALDRVAAALAADLMGVAIKAVNVEIADQQGYLALAIATPIPLPSLDRGRHASAQPTVAHATILERVTAAQVQLQDQFTAMTGAQVGHVTIRLNGIATNESRVLR